MENTTDDEMSTRHVSAHDTPDNVLDRQTKGRRIQALLNELPEKIRAVLFLQHYEDLSIKEIATVLDIPEGTVKSRLHKGIKQLTVLAEKRGLSNEM
jgi:RNA polymerase sigma-70 factor (ECF subfamily)